MASSLVGLVKLLTWNDFKGNPTPAELNVLNQASARSGKTVGMAGIYTSFSVSFGGTPPQEPVLTAIQGTTPQAFALADTIVVTITFDGGRSWRRTAPLTAKGEQLLLDHEQGHYDFTALMARDCFIDLMALKARTFSSAAEGQTAAKEIVKSHKAKLERVQEKYDDDTTHGAWVTPSFLPERKETFQTRWEGFVQRARSEERPPVDGVSLESPADGVRYKVRLLDVLASAGFTF